MTTADFTPLPFNFTATFDSAPYTVTVTWSLTGQRYYFRITDTSGGTILYGPLIASPANYNINLIGGYFTTSTLVFLAETQQFVVTP